jgi:hypothetical protein
MVSGIPRNRNGGNGGWERGHALDENAKNARTIFWHVKLEKWWEHHIMPGCAENELIPTCRLQGAHHARPAYEPAWAELAL